MYCAQGAVDRESGLGQQRQNGFKHVAALNSAVQVAVHVPDEAWLPAEIQETLHAAQQDNSVVP